MGRHALRGMVSAWLTLIVLQTVGSTGSGRISGLFSDADRLVKRALDPNVPAIPDRRNGAPGTGSVATGAGAAAHFYGPGVGPVANGAAAAATAPWFSPR